MMGFTLIPVQKNLFGLSLGLEYQFGFRLFFKTVLKCSRLLASNKRYQGALNTLKNVEMVVELIDEEPYYYINAETEGSGLCADFTTVSVSFYGPIPRMSQAEDVAGLTFPIEFTGEGDDANLCISDLDVYHSARFDSSVTIERVEKDIAYVSFTGSFTSYEIEEAVANSVPDKISGTLEARLSANSY